LKSLKGFGSNYFSNSSIPSLGRLKAIQQGVFINRYYGYSGCPLEWYWKISLILKDGNLSDKAFNNLSRIHLSYSATVSREISSETLPAFYDERMKLCVK
jgi:hypothetical protein